MLVTLTAAITSCNSEVKTDEVLPTSAVVRSFTLSNDDKVLPHLDSIFFSIDLYSGAIYNADSLPYGTNVSRLVPVILTDGASVAELSVPRPNLPDTLYNYLENSTDSIDFSNGPVKLRVVSLDGQTERNYSIKVNVHKQISDSLEWSRPEQRSVPSPFDIVTQQATAMMGQTYCVITRYGQQYGLATATDPEGPWNTQTIHLPFQPVLNSLRGTINALYMLDAQNNVYTSTDGTTWTSTGQKMNNLIAGYQNRLIGTVQNGGNWKIVTYPGNQVTDAPSGFPVTGTSQGVTYVYEMSITPQLVIVGGRTPEGHLTDNTWAYDGTTWANITKTPMPRRLENMTLTPYFTTKADTATWRMSRQSVLVAMNGTAADGTINDTIYISPDCGMHWTKAPARMQPDARILPERTQAQAFTHDRKFGVTSRSRAVTPITQWSAPSIYMFGGVNRQGVTYNTLWRGTINSLTFKPLQ